MRVIIFDTETTGLTLHPLAEIEAQPRIIEFAAAIVDSEQAAIVDEFDQLINPTVNVTEEITRITGITNQMLVNQPLFPVVLPRIAELFSSAHLMCAHNFAFDDAMLRNEMRRWNLNGSQFPWPKQGVCTVVLYTEEFGYGPKLIELYQTKIGKPYAQTHRALDDVRALAEVFIKEELWMLFPS